MSAAFEGARCHRHEEVVAEGTCTRCGLFVCIECARRTRPEARALCPDCWERRTAHVASLNPPQPLAAISAVLGVLSLLPLPPIQVAALVTGIVALRRGQGRPELAYAGIGLSIVGMVLFGLLMFYAD